MSADGSNSSEETLGESMAADASVAVAGARSTGESVMQRLQRESDTVLSSLVLIWLSWADLLLSVSRASSFWHDIERCQEIWKQMCSRIWETKAYVPKEAKSLCENGEARCAFKKAWLDAKRDVIAMEELISFTWCTRMKESAGSHFTDDDPWWQGGQARRVTYFEDGSTLILDQSVGTGVLAPRGEYGRWRFFNSSSAEEGSLVRWRPVVSMQEVPTQVVLRDPKTWGFILDSCWHVQTSFPMPPKGEDAAYEDDALPTTFDTQQAEALAYNRGRMFGELDEELRMPLLHSA